MILYWTKFKDILWWHDTVFKTVFWNWVLLLSSYGEDMERFDCWVLSTSLWKCVKYILCSPLWASCTWCTCTPTHVTAADLVYIGHQSVTFIHSITACVRKLKFLLFVWNRKYSYLAGAYFFIMLWPSGVLSSPLVFVFMFIPPKLIRLRNLN